MTKYDQEVICHKETIAKFNADKKHILLSTEEANLEAIKGESPGKIEWKRQLAFHKF